MPRMARVLVLTAFLGVAAWASDIAGAWKGVMQTPDGNTLELTCTFHQDGAKLTGSVLVVGQILELANGKIEGDKLWFTVHVDLDGGTNFVSEGAVNGDSITLNTRQEGAEHAFPPVTLKREK